MRFKGNISLIKFFYKTKMKRQLTSILLFSALLVGGGSTFVSCTDHESDAAYTAQGSIADELNKQAAELQRQITELKNIISGTNGLTDQINNLKTELANKQAELEDLINQKDQAQTAALNAATEALKTELNNKINNLDTKITNVNTDVQNLKNDLANTQADVEALKNRIANAEQAITEAKEAAINASKDYTDTKVAEAAAAAQQALTQAVSDLQAQLTACHTECKAYTDEQIASIKTITNALSTTLSQQDTKITELYTKQSELEAKLLQDSLLIKQVSDNVTTLQTAVNNINTKLTDLTTLYNDLNTKLDGKVSKEDFDALKAIVEANKASINDLNTKLDSKVSTEAFEALKAIVEANKAQSDANKAAIEEINQKIVNFVTKTELDNKASELQDAFKAADDQLKSEIQTQIDAIQTQLNELFNAMMNMITGIEIQATESPISGYENLSCLGVEAHILGTYYGFAADGDVQLNGQTVINGNNELLIDSESGENAGIVYATINPSSTNFAGLTLKVVDSQGNEAPFTATVFPSDKVLKYGVTRSSVKSNLYAIKINLNKDKIDAAKTWTAEDAKELKSAAKNVLDKLRQPSKNRLNVADIASSISSVFNNRLTAYGLQAEQDLGGETRLITSKLNLAATALKPLSYNFLKDNKTISNLDLPSFPTLQSIVKFNDYKFNWTPIANVGNVKTSITLEGMPDLDNITIDGSVVVPVPSVGVSFAGKTVTGTADKNTGVVTVDLSTLDLDFDVEFKTGGGTVKIDKDNFKITIPQDQTKSYDVTISMDDFNKIIDKINSQVGNMVENVNNIIDKVTDYAEDIDGRYINRINNFIQRFENVLRKSNSLLQPAIFYTTTSGSWGQLARESEGASYLKLNGGKASTVLVASSYTGEILAPAYKKCISVTSKPAGATVSGTKLNEVIDGNLHKIGFEADKAGTYELTYEAVDYSGVKVSRKFYIKVVD